MEIEEQLKKLKDLMDTAVSEGNFFVRRGNKAAGKRCRLALAEIRSLSNVTTKSIMAQVKK
jgi:hypothetical protein